MLVVLGVIVCDVSIQESELLVGGGVKAHADRRTLILHQMQQKDNCYTLMVLFMDPALTLTIIIAKLPFSEKEFKLLLWRVTEPEETRPVGFPSAAW